MLRQLELTRRTTHIQVEIVNYDGYLRFYLERAGEEVTEVKTQPLENFCDPLSAVKEECEVDVFNKECKKTFLPLVSICDGVATLNITNEVHCLPFGYYELVIMSCSCECSRYKVHIPKCKTTRPATCADDTGCLPISTTCALPERKCEPCVVSAVERTPNESMCPTLCDNKISESKGLRLPWDLTKVEENV